MKKSLTWVGKSCSYTIIALALVLLLVTGFLFSSLATPMFRWASNSFVENLSIQEVSGSLYSGLTFDGVTYTTPELSIELKHIKTGIDWQCSSFTTLCVNNIQIDNSNILLNSTESSESTTKPTKELITLPINIQLQRIALTSLQLKSGDLTINLAQLQTEVTFSDVLTVNNTRLSDLHIHSNAVPSEPKPFTGLSYTAPELTDIWIPLHIRVSDFDANSVRYTTESSEQIINQISVASAQIQGADVAWETANIDHNQAIIDSSGKVTLEQSFVLEMSLNASLDVSANVDGNNNVTQQLSLTASGALDALALQADLAGLVTGDASLQLNLLSDNLPIDGIVHWPGQAVNYSTIQVLESGSIEVNGSMTNYALVVDSAATLEQIERVTFKANIDVSSDQLNVKQLDATLLGGSVVTNGKVSFIDGINALGSTQITNINASSLVPSLTSLGVSNASWEYVTQQTDSGIILLITNLNGVGEIEEHFIDVDGQIAYYQAQDLAVANLSMKQQGEANKIELLAQILNKQKLSINSTIALPTPSKILNGLAGSIAGNINVLGTWENPEFSIDLAADKFVVAPNISTFLAEQGLINSKVKGSGTLQDHNITLSTSLQDYNIELALAGGMKNNRYTGQMNTANTRIMNSEWALSQPLNFGYDLSSQNGHVAAHCWMLMDTASKVTNRSGEYNSGQFCIEQARYENQQALWNIDAKQLPIGEWVQSLESSITHVSASAKLNASSQGQYSLISGLVVDAQLNVEESTWTFNSDNPVNLTLNTIEATVALDQQSINAQILFESKEIGSVSVSAVTNSHEILSGNMDGNVNANLTVDNVKLKPLAGISPSIHRLEGVINGQVKVTGVIKKPKLNGLLSLKNGYIDAEQSPLALSKWNQTFIFENQQANIEGNFTLGDGSGVLEGLVSWEQAPYAELDVKADDISLAYEDSKLRISPNLRTKITTDEISVNGDLNIPYARIKLKQLPQSAVTPSKDVHLWGEERSTDPIKNINADINVNIDKNKTREVKLDAFGLTANLYGELQIQNQPSTVGYGDLQILDGRYKAYGQNLLIRTGEVQFNGPIGQPFLFVEAIRDPNLTEDDVIAGVRIDGPASGPNVSLFSEPTMEQSENLLYLVNGSGNLSSSGETNYGAILLGLGLSQSGRITNSVGNALGIQDLSFSTSGQGSDSQVSLSGNITKDLSVRFGIGLSEGQEVAIRYRILPHLYLEAVRQLSTAVSYIDLFYEFSIGDPAKQNATNKEGNNKNGS